MAGREDNKVVLGRISSAHGVRGWVRAVSFTDPPAALSRYSVFEAASGIRLDVEATRAQGEAVLIKFGGVEDRDAAAALAGTELAVRRSELPPTQPGEFYWADLIGLQVESLNGAALGRVERLMEVPGQGADQTVMVLGGDRERLIPIVRGRTVRRVDLESGRMVVDWDADW